MLQDRRQQLERVHHVLMRELARARDRAGDQRLADRAVLGLIALVELVEVFIRGRPHRGAGERASEPPP